MSPGSMAPACGFRHPDAGRIDLDYIKLALADNDTQDIIVFPPADGATEVKLRRLA